MYANLKKLEAKIINKNRELQNVYKRHKTAAQNNFRFVNGRINKNTYNNTTYIRNITNATRVAYNERKPLMNEYNKAVANYRKILGLPVMTGRRGPAWPTHIVFSRSKRTTNTPLPRVNNIYNKYQKFGATTGSGGGFGNRRVSLGIHYHKFYPNIQLYNALVRQRNKELKERKAAKVIKNALMARIYRPSNKSKNNKGGAMFKKAMERFYS